ncbi:DUF397 domain-containing protein [Streptomyces sp. SID4919]|uniref:DUF397 domain-containing protein n=1 Tax=unclassified Streptomyces TaxID=2593676 RepID=UPI000823A93E|nr:MULTISPECIES: DUF397 domain-containing protein [unclassified Streptomyces]MYY12944.1 DUF397 domain-containing protein [Streptomyces sp. SID4919]SCK22459.1 protein of unknown function [Streptomyces sp. AmelKG-E11A]
MSHQVPAIRWVRSSYSSGEGGQCVEWAPGHAAVHGVVPVRDSKVAAGPVLMVGVEGWAGLVALARRADV